MLGISINFNKLIIIITIVGLSLPLQAADVYRWIDKEGITHLTDMPPEEMRESRILKVPDTETEIHTGKQAVPEQRSVASAPAETVFLHKIKNFPIVHQERKWCALATIEMVARYYGFSIDQRQVSLEADIPYNQGMTLNAILKYFERLKILMLNIDYHYGGDIESIKRLIDDNIPIIWLHHVPISKRWMPHAAVVIGYDDALRKMVVADPAYGFEVMIPYTEFLRRWYRTNNLIIIVTSKL